MKPAKGPFNGKLFTEEDWNDESSLTDGPYRFSKVGHASSMLVCEVTYRLKG